MHIPDGFLDLKTTVATGVLAAAGVGVALRHARLTLTPRRVPLMGLSAAFIFAAQMLNFPVAGGTSGHLVGGALAAALLGPAAAVIVLAAVLIVQCLMFADGGLLALGANVFNLGVVHPLVGYAVYRSVFRFFPNATGRVLAAGFAAWCATVVTAIICAGELASSKRVDWSAAFTAMTWVHMLIGVGEAAITAMTLAAVVKTRPDLLEPSAAAAAGFPVEPSAPDGASPVDAAAAGSKATDSNPWASPRPRGGVLTFTCFGLLVALGLAIFVAPFASPFPDGLEKVSEVLGFAEAAQENLNPAPAPDYEMGTFRSAAVKTAVAGGVGTAVMFGLAYGFARLLTRKEREPAL